jgi:hypothetical protein
MTVYSSNPTYQFDHQIEEYFDTLGANLSLNQMKNLPHKFMNPVILFCLAFRTSTLCLQAQCSFIPSSFVSYDLLPTSSIEYSFTVNITRWIWKSRQLKYLAATCSSFLYVFSLICCVLNCFVYSCNKK